MAYIRADRAVVDSARRRTLLSSVVRLADRLIRGFLAVKLSIKLRLPLFGIMLLAGCGVKNERCYENGNISFKEIAADLCPHDPTYEIKLKGLNYGVERPKLADRQNFGILSDLMSGVCILPPPCPESEPAPEIRPEPIILPPPPTPEIRDVVELIREAPADAGATPPSDAVAMDASAEASAEADAATEDIARRRDAQRRENGNGRETGTQPSDAGRPEAPVIPGT